MTDPNPNSSAPRPIPLVSGLAIASFVLGILAAVLSLVGIGLVLGLIGLVLGAIHLRRGPALRSLAWWGTGLSVFGIAASLAMGLFYYSVYKQYRDMLGGAGEDAIPLTSWEGVPAPDISITTLEGETIQLSDLKGKRVVLDFWATWCPPCVKEIPHFVQLAKENSTDELVIIGISDEEEETLKPFVRKHQINYAIASGSDLPSPYADVRSIPTTFFIDRKGIIQTVLTGYHDLDSLRQNALAEDYPDEPKPAPAPDPSADSDDSANPAEAGANTLAR
jgi:peroxiredoxin